jgi:hypothetical protein
VACEAVPMTHRTAIDAACLKRLDLYIGFPG